MKRITMSALLFITLFLSACGSEPGEIVSGNFVAIQSYGNYDIIRDKNTGCIYYQYIGGYSLPLTPYYDEEGEVAGCGDTDFSVVEYGLEDEK